MDFISNLMKRPISLVLNGTPTTTDTISVSSSLPNSPSVLEAKQDSSNEQQKHILTSNNNNNRSLSMRSSYSGGNITDFIGVPEEFLAEFEDFLPPPPPLSQSPLNMADNRSLSITPPPPLTSSMKASQTIDELLLQINDNLQEAGLNDDVLLAIASPPNKAELSPLSSKAALNNSKLLTPSSNSSSAATNTQLNITKTPTSTTTSPTFLLMSAAAAGTAAANAATVFEANSSIHKFHVDPELETGLFDDHHRQETQQQLLNTSGVNRSSNKFVGLTEFDEAKIPELPGDLNPNIEEQYNVTFEECFIPTLTARQSTKVPDEFMVDKTHLLLPSETDTAVSSDNETFADCQDDERDPLAATFAEQPSTLDVTTDMESYQSANNNTIFGQHNSTMDNIADITMEAEEKTPQQQANQIEVRADLRPESIQQFEAMDEDEPMDVDMNATMEMMQSSANNIQHVERVLQHAENILHALEQQNSDELLAKQCATSKMAIVVNTPKESILNKTQHLEIEQSKHELSLNKSIELVGNKTKTVSSECIIETVNNDQEAVEEVQPLPELVIDDIQVSKDMTKSLNNNNLTIDCMTSSTSSTTSLKSSGNKTETKLNLTLGMSSSITSQKSSAPNSPSFPLKHTNNPGFPRSPKAVEEQPQQTPFLEKSDYFEKPQQSLSKNNVTQKKDTSTDLLTSFANNLNDTHVVATPVVTASADELTSISNNLNGTYVEAATTSSLEVTSIPQHDKVLTIGIDTLKLANDTEELHTIPQLPSVANILNDTYVEVDTAIQSDKLPTFDVNISEPIYTTEINTNPLELKIPSSQDNRLSSSVDSLDQGDLEKFAELGSVSNESRRTFSVQLPNENLSTESSGMQFPSCDKPDNARRTFCINDVENPNQESHSNSMKNSRRTFNVSSEEQAAKDTSFEAMDVDDTESQNTTMPVELNEEQVSQSPPLPAMQQRYQSPALPAMQQNSQSPPLPNIEQNSESPAALLVMEQRSQSPALPAMQQKSQSPPIPAMQQKSKSPPLPTMQQKSQYPPLPAMQHKSQSPPLPTMQKKSQSSRPLLPPRTLHKPIPIKEEPISPLPESNSASISLTSQPPPQNPFTSIQKRPSIHDHAARARGDILSAKEQSSIKDEKDIFVEKFTPSPVEDVFTAVSATSTTLDNSSGFSNQTFFSSSSSLVNNEELHKQQQQEFDDEKFQGNNNLIFNSSDFDYLLTKGNNNAPVDRSSLLLKFDPLLGMPVPVNQGQQQPTQQLQQLQIPTDTNNPCLSPTLEEDEHNDSIPSFDLDTKQTTGLQGAAQGSAKLLKERSQEVIQQLQWERQQQQELQLQNKRQLTQGGNKNNATMSVDVIKDISLDNDCNKTLENSNSTQSDDKQINYKMDELEKKIKNEVLKTEDIEKKLKDAEQREEALIKRITEKDKTVSKMNGVIEAYEKAIAELIAEKEQLIQNYEKQLAEVKADRDSNYHHLTSLETTFSDLHVKYEKSKEMTCQLKANEDALVTENRKTLENLRLQEQRYDKMKNHAMQQLEIANKKLESLTRDHSIESTKLKALLKKEEIARSSITEQLTQKTKENAELVKICDELISGQGS